MKLYGIPNCETVKKAQRFLEARDVEYEFINFKKSPPETEQLLRWKEAMGEWPVNKKGLTYKKFKDEYEKLKDKDIPSFLSKNSSMVKRPILEKKNKVLAFGFIEEEYKKLSF